MDRIVRSEPWVAIPRALLRDGRMSPKAKGGLVTLLSHEEGWVRSSIALLQRECSCGRAQAQAIMAELVSLGYARLVRTGGRGGARCYYEVYDRPVGNQQLSGPEPAGPDGVENQRLSAPEPVDIEHGDGNQRVSTLKHAGSRADGKPAGRESGLEKIEPLDVEPTSTQQEIFGALLRACGWTPPLSASSRQAIGAVAKQLVAVGATPEEIESRAEAYRRTFPGAALTPTALAKWWPALAGGPAPVDLRSIAVEVGAR